MGISRIGTHDHVAKPYERHLAYVIDQNGRPSEVILLREDSDEASELVFAYLPSSLHDPIWDGKKWIEGKRGISLANWLRIISIVLLLALACSRAHGQGNTNVSAIGGTKVPSGAVDTGNSAIKVSCVVGCSAAGSFTDNSAFTVGATSVTNLGAYYTSGADPSISTGNSGRLRMDSHSYLAVDCLVGCAGGSTTPSDAFANPTTAGLQFDFLAVWNGATWDRWKGDATNGAFVNVKTSVLPTGAATEATLGTIDADIKANVTLHAGTNLIGKVGIDQTTPGTTNAVAATNFPATVDTNSGNKSASTIRVVLATDQPALTNKLLVTPDSVALPANQSVNVAQIAGQTTTTTDNGTQGVAPQGTASSTGAVLGCNILSAASTNSTNCKGSTGNFYGFEIYNTTTTIYYLRLYNTASAPTCSSSTGFIRSIPIKAADAAGGLGGAISNQPFPVNYGTGISFCITGGSSSTDNTNAAVGIFGEIRYK